MEYTLSWVRHARTDGIQEGRKIGRVEGQRVLLTDLLQQRFGMLPASVLQRIEAAETRQVLAWSRAFVGAETLEQVFDRPAPPPFRRRH